MGLDRGVQLLKYGNQEEAIEFFMETLYEDPLNLEAIKYVGIAYTESGRQEEAVKALTFFTERIQDNSEAWEGLGCAYYRLKNFGKARECFSRAFSISPNENSVIRNFGLTCMVLQEEDKAYELLEKAITLDKKDYRSIYALSSLCIRSEKYEEAEQLLRNIKDDVLLPADLKDLIESNYQKVKRNLRS